MPVVCGDRVVSPVSVFWKHRIQQQTASAFRCVQGPGWPDTANDPHSFSHRGGAGAVARGKELPGAVSAGGVCWYRSPPPDARNGDGPTELSHFRWITSTIQPSLRDGSNPHAPGPGVETPGYRHLIASRSSPGLETGNVTRRCGTGVWKFPASVRWAGGRVR